MSNTEKRLLYLIRELSRMIERDEMEKRNRALDRGRRPGPANKHLEHIDTLLSNVQTDALLTP